MKKQDDWTTMLRNRLADGNAPVPDDMWSRIERQLDGAADGVSAGAAGAAPRTAARRRTVRMAAWMAAAAAVAALLVARWWPEADVAGPRRQYGRAVVAYDRQGRSNVPIKEELLAKVGAAPQLGPASVVAVERQPCSPASAAAETGGIAVAEAVGSGVDAAVGGADDSPESKPSVQQSAARHVPHTNYYASASIPVSRGSAQASGGRWSVGAHTEGGLADSRSMQRPAMPSAFCSASMLMSASGDGVSAEAGGMNYPMLLAKYKEVRHHMQPVSFGVSVGYAVTDRVRLTTGVVYTQATSDFISSSQPDEVVSTQKLHYIGVPLTLRYKVWGTDRVQTYATAGAQADFNVSATMTTGGIKSDADRDRPQFSAGAAAGVQLNVLPQVGIYAEPGVKYYFDNGSRVETIYKEKKLSFNLQLGLRLDF